MSWIIKRLFSDKNLGYIIEKARPKIKEVIGFELKEEITKAFEDPEFIEVINTVTDAYYERYRRKFFGSIGGLQKGLNSEMAKQTGDLDVFNAEGQISIKKILPKLIKFVMSGQKQGTTRGNQGNNGYDSSKGSQNAPQM